jgi:response regulator RpfG family c-di-GMP phosphodiesterase
MGDGLARIGVLLGGRGLRDELGRLRTELAERERAVGEKERQLERYAADLRETFKEERARSAELRRSYVQTVRALTNAVEARDAYTGKHAERVAAYGLEIARAIDARLARDPQAEMGFLLHDIGKVAIPDGVLHKAGPLTEAEEELMRQHVLIGCEILAGIEFLGDALSVIRHHHERWDGQGYPDGLAGDAIPLSARVFSVADAIDAITTDRPYRPGRPLAEAREEIARGAGAQFDPDVVEALGRVPDETFERIRREID